MSNSGEKLTLMQRLFINAFTAFGAETEGKPLLSARAAGCKGKDAGTSVTASKWLKMPKIKTVIDGINAHKQAVVAEKTGYTMEVGLAKVLHAYEVAEKLNQPAAMVSAVVTANRMHGYDKDAAIGEKTVIVIGPRVVEDRPKPIESKELENE